MRDGLMGTVVRGAAAGAVGTAVMTVLQLGGRSSLVPQSVQRKFPPKLGVEWAEAQAGPGAQLGNGEKAAAIAGVHLAYGMGSGAAYGLLRERLDGVPAPLAGAVFGVGLWAAGFEGWMPAVGMKAPEHRLPPRKWVLPVVTHVVYGLTTAWAYERSR